MESPSATAIDATAGTAAQNRQPKKSSKAFKIVDPKTKAVITNEGFEGGVPPVPRMLLQQQQQQSPQQMMLQQEQQHQPQQHQQQGTFLVAGATSMRAALAHAGFPHEQCH
mmetsp:Transcript_33998/g.65811  ORF Transcript_33998/g.65811 Transcript_33998/m.65811 type:complete len:111 (-) Transcript_33998:187-519(-)